MVLPQVPCYPSGGVLQDPLPEEVQLHPAIAIPLDQLQALELAFDRSGRPGERQRGLHRRIIPPEPLRTVAQLHAEAGMAGVEPGIQVRRLPLADHRRPLAPECCHLAPLGMLLEALPERRCVCWPLLGGLQDEPGALAGGASVRSAGPVAPAGAMGGAHTEAEAVPPRAAHGRGHAATPGASVGDTV